MADKTVKVTLRGDISQYNKALLAAAAGTKAFARTLDTSNDRMSNFTQSALAIGPALIPIGAAGVPALAGLANQLGFAAAGAGVAAIAFNGVGDALQAVNAYGIEPTDANLQALAKTMQTLGPAGREFVMFLQEMRPQMQELQNIAQAGLFPGLQAGLSDLLTLMPKFEGIVDTISQAMGDISAEAGANLAGPGWTEFFDFLEREARPTLISMAATMGNFARGFAELWMAFDPLSDQFSASFLQMSRDFASWADGLSATDGFQEFLAYVSDVGPKAWDALGAIGNALLQVVQAAAPVGAIALPVVEALADALAVFVNTPAGPALILAASGLAALSRAIALYNVANGSALLRLLSGGGIGLGLASTLGQGTKQLNQLNAAAGVTAPTLGRLALSANQLKAGLRGGAVAGGLALALTEVDDKAGLANASMGAMAGLMITGGPWGAAIGGAIGLAVDYASANDDISSSLQRATAAANDDSLSIQSRIAAIDAEIAAVKRLRAEKLASENAGTVAQSEVTGGTSTRGPDVGAEDAALKQHLATKRELIAADQEATFAEFGLTNAMRGSSQATRESVAANLARISSMNALMDGIQTAFDAETAYRQAILAARDAGRQNNAGITKNTEAANANRAALSQLAGAWDALAAAGGQTTGTLKSARRNFIELAVSMGVPRAEARRLARELLNLPNPKPKITLQGVEGALNKISNVSQRLRSLDGTTARTFVQIKESYADGGFVRRFDDGGRVSGPGGPRDDKIPAMLSNGEFVVNAAATRKYLPDLYKMNAQKFAAGGLVPMPLQGQSAAPLFATAGAAPAATGLTEREQSRAFRAALEGMRFQLDKDGRHLQLSMRRG